MKTINFNSFNPKNWLPLFEDITYPNSIIILNKAYLDFLNESSIYIPDHYFGN